MPDPLPVARRARRRLPPWPILLFASLLLAGVLAGAVVGVRAAWEALRGRAAAVAEAKERRRSEADLVPAERLLADYKDNEVGADGAYRDRMVRVRGVVHRVAKDITDKPYVILTEDGERGVNAVQCYFPPGAAGVDGLRRGDEVTISGVCGGKALLNVVLKDCRVE